MAKTELAEDGPWQEIILLNGWEWRGRPGALLHEESCVSHSTQNRDIHHKARREHETRCLEASISPSPSEAGHNPLQ